MRYLILSAGQGTRLQPYTKSFPKCMVDLGVGKTVIQRNISLIKEIDKSAEIFLILGFKRKEIEENIREYQESCTIVYNPFYKVTNSAASLWLAKEWLNDSIIIINGDIVLEKKLMENLINSEEDSFVTYDSSIVNSGDYSVRVKDNFIIVMGKNLNRDDGEYAGFIKLSKDDSILLKKELETSIEDNFDTWYETILVQLILSKNFKIKAKDIANYTWTEIDNIDHIFLAKDICSKE